jgi:hypothetical protein
LSASIKAWAARGVVASSAETIEQERSVGEWQLSSAEMDSAGAEPRTETPPQFAFAGLWTP